MYVLEQIIPERDCKNKETSEYMYRIIGIDSSNRIKLIKNTTITETTGTGDVYEFRLHSTTGVVWDLDKSNTSMLLKRLNGEATSPTASGVIKGNAATANSNIFVGSEKYTYMNNSTWTNKIASMTWNIGEIDDTAATSASKTYEAEKKSTSSSFKISLMSASDYYYSSETNASINCYEGSGNSATCKTTWLNISHNGDSRITTGELTQSTKNTTIIRPISVYGHLTYSSSYANGGNPSRPVFFLENTVELTGVGTIDDPIVVLP